MKENLVKSFNFMINRISTCKLSQKEKELNQERNQLIKMQELEDELS